VAGPELDVGTPLTDEEFERLMEFLDEHVPFGGEGFFGLLHAVAVAPSPIPASRWMSVVLPEQGLAATKAPEQIIAHVVQSLCEVMSALAQQIAMTPPEDDEAACEQFAAGYVAGAELDPEWRGNADGMRRPASHPRGEHGSSLTFDAGSRPKKDGDRP
jgi:hypothetical protein